MPYHSKIMRKSPPPAREVVAAVRVGTSIVRAFALALATL